jgi:hypothetical protein
VRLSHVEVGHVALESHRLGALVFKRPNERVGHVGRGVISEGDACPRFGKRLDDGTADPPGSSRYENRFSTEIDIHRKKLRFRKEEVMSLGIEHNSSVVKRRRNGLEQRGRLFGVT